MSALATVFQFQNTRYAGSDYTSTPDLSPYFANIVNPDLDAGLPVLFGISGSNGAHEIVCDGYGYESGTLYHHLNMGFSGDDNVWYNLPTIRLNDLGVTFNTVTGCLYNLYPTGSGEVISGRVLDATGMPVAGAIVSAMSGTTNVATVTSNARGIYALARVPSATDYSLTASKTGYPTTTINVTTGTSVSSTDTVTATSAGNVWGADIRLSLSAPLLSLSTSCSLSTALPGTTLTYTLNYANTGNAVATGVTLTDVLPAVVSYIANSATGGGSFASSTHSVSWSISDLPANDTGSVTLQVIVNANAVLGSNVSNAASITATQLTTPVSSNAAVFSVGAGARGDWWMFHHDPLHSGRATVTGMQSAVTKWTFSTLDWIYSSAIFGVDGTIYVGSEDGNLYAINANGTLKWAFPTGNEIDSSPALGTDGTIYVGAYDGNLYAVNADGTQKWIFATGAGIISSPVLGTDGTIYIGSEDNNLYAISPNGKQKWAFSTANWIISSPALAADGTIYVGSEDYNLYAINPDGSAHWSTPFVTGNAIDSSPVLGIDGTIYIGSDDNNLYAVNPDGTQQWVFPTGNWITSSPALGADGTIYVGSQDDHLYAVKPDGSPMWTVPFATGGVIDSSPAVGADGTIYVGSWDGSLYAVNTTGTKLWSYPTGDWIDASPAIGPDGTVVIGSANGTLCAIGQATSPTTLQFSTQPSTTMVNAPISPAVTVIVQDTEGNTVSTATTAVTLALGTHPQAATLGGTLTVNAVNGVATFNDLSLNVSAGGYTLTATAAGLTSAASQPFTILPLSPPTISSVAKQLINMGAATPALSFIVSDSVTPLTALTVTGVSSNTALVKPSGIVLSAPDANGRCTVTVTPVNTYSGVTTMTLIVQNSGGLSAKTNFSLTVNGHPSITPIAAQAITMNSATPSLPFTVRDDLTPSGSLAVIGASSNTTLVPVANIVFGGAGALRTVTVTPSTGIGGKATITLTVTDANGLTKSTSFLLAVYTPPTISAIADQAIIMGTATRALGFSVSDNVTPVSALIVSATSSNSPLVSAVNISFIISPGGARYVKVTPAAGRIGTATITLSVANAYGLTVTTSFTVTVKAQPTITSIANQFINMGNATSALAFSVAELQTPANTLTVTCVSSNSALIRSAGILLIGPDTMGLCAVTLTPVTAYSGQTTITLTVTDSGGMTATTHFTLTVNRRPTITLIAHQLINLNQFTPTLPFTVGDDLTAVDLLSVACRSSNPTLFPAIRLILGGSGASRTLSVRPAAGQSGTATITLTVKDGGGLTATTSLTVTVNAPPTIISPTNQAINMGSSAVALPFTVVDDLTPLASLMLTCAASNTALVHTDGIVLTGPDSQGHCTVTLTPVAVYSGMTTIVLMVTDGGGQTTKTSFILTVNR